MYEGNIFRIDLRCNDLSKFPRYLFEEARKSLILSFGMSVDYSIHLESNDIELKVEDKNIFWEQKNESSFNDFFRYHLY